MYTTLSIRHVYLYSMQCHACKQRYEQTITSMSLVWVLADRHGNNRGTYLPVVGMLLVEWPTMRYSTKQPERNTVEPCLVDTLESGHLDNADVFECPKQLSERFCILCIPS